MTAVEPAPSSRKSARRGRYGAFLTPHHPGRGCALGSPERGEYDDAVEATRTALGEEAFATAWAAGRALSLEEAIRYALDETREG